MNMVDTEVFGGIRLILSEGLLFVVNDAGLLLVVGVLRMAPAPLNPIRIHSTIQGTRRQKPTRQESQH